jgi:hypothetical protein
MIKTIWNAATGDYRSVFLGAAAALVLVGGAAWLRLALIDQGRQIERAATAAKTIEAFKTRQKVNNETSSLSDYDLCLALVSMRDGAEKCRELRRVAAPAKGQ